MCQKRTTKKHTFYIEDPDTGPTVSSYLCLVGFQLCHGQKSRFFGDGHPTFTRNPYDGYINPYYCIGLMTIPYYMETMGV